MHINLTADGMYAFESSLLKAAERGDDLKPVLEVIARKMILHEKRVFDTSGASVGRPWKVLDPETVAGKVKHGDPFPAKPLMGSLRLYHSLTQRGNPEMILRITDSFIQYGTSVPYAGFLDDGTEDMDKRRPIMFSMNQAQEYYRDIQNYIFNNELPKNA